jgi:hypothetical protein
MMKKNFIHLLGLTGLVFGANAAESASHDFDKEVKPLLETFCIRCHGERKQKGEVRLDMLDPDMVKGMDAEKWHAALDVINTADMPPDDVKQPSKEERQIIVDWMTSELKHAKEIKRGEQNNVMRRLTKEQYSNTLQDLLGVEANFGKKLPPDPLSHMGFSNSGEVLSMSQLQFEYYEEIAREALGIAIGPKEKPVSRRYQLEFGDKISNKVYNKISGYKTIDLSGRNFHTHVFDDKGRQLKDTDKTPQGELVEDVKKSIMVDFRGSDRERFGMAKDGVVLYGALPHIEQAPTSWHGASPNLKMLIRNHFPEFGSFIFRVKASRGEYLDSNSGFMAVKTTMVSYKNNKLSAPNESMIFDAADAKMGKNLKLKNGTLVSIDRGNVSEATFKIQLPESGVYQFDVLRPALDKKFKNGVLALRMDGEEFRLKVKSKSKLEKQGGEILSPLAIGEFEAGEYDLEFGSPNFLGLSKVIISRLGGGNPLEEKYSVARQRSEASQALYKNEQPSIQAFVGARGDDGMDHKNFGPSKVIKGAMGVPALYEFEGRLEDLPVPVKDLSSENKLANIMIVGLYNDNLVKSKEVFGAPLKVHSVEFEAPYYPEWPMQSYKNIFPDGDQTSDAYTKELIQNFMNRAFRKNVAQGKIDKYFNYWKQIKADYKTYEDGIKEVLVAVLCSPEFLYLTEAKMNKQVNDQAFVNRLSYFLWNTAPDEKLMELVYSGELNEQLDSELDRMINDPRMKDFIKQFAKEWLRLDRLESMSVNIEKYPDFTRFIKRDMKLETLSFLEYCLEHNLPVTAFIDSDFAMLNQNLAEFYGIEGVRGNEFRRVQVSSESHRGGILTHGSILTGHSDGNQAHPIKRAVWLMEKLLNDEPPPPPPNVPELDSDNPSFAGLTIKQQLELHREKSSCISCHEKIDPWGVVFEKYDAVGRFNTEADAKTELLDGTELDGLDELKAYVLKNKKRDVLESVTRHLLAYALGRDLSYMDNEDIDQIVSAVESEGYGFQDLIKAIVKHKIFKAN